MKKIILGLTALLAAAGGFWLWRNKERLENEAHQHGMDDQLRGKAMQFKGDLTGDTKTKLKGDLLNGRGDIKAKLMAAKEKLTE
ncbi:hypothetical protein [Lactiplantibacillus herbarum]|uniref:hypothetical protein n=1 Tax=Lactiplantibacillus herbarum TaxID=1670446 RepID=UPI00064E2420|nr:hypothetical protein [Lactiplantibacillus herbarum]